MSALMDWRNGLGYAALVTVLAWPTPVTAATPGSGFSPQVLAELDSIMGKDISDSTPGCAVGIQSKGANVLRAYGQADLESHVSNSVGSVFNIASVSKQFTAAAVLLLANEDKLALDDDVRKYLPELQAWERPITIDHLLSHTSGLRDFRFTDWMLGRDALPQHNSDVLAYAARQQSLNHAPGESHLYTNTGYVLLALIVERVSGRSFQDFTRERLFEPAGMTHTQSEDDSRRVVANRSSGYAQLEPAQDGKPARFQQMLTARHTFGHGNLLTTVGDMQRWNAALSRNTYGPKLTAQMEEPARLRNGFMLDYARGVFVGKYRGLREVQHSGYNGNYTAWVGRYPDADVAVSLLCNGDGDNVSPRDLVNLVLPKDVPERDTAQEAPPSSKQDLSTHSGVYRRVDNGQLTLWTFSKDARMEDGRHVLGPYNYEFDPADPARIVLRSYGNASEWIQVPEHTPPTATLGEFQGHFISEELLAGYNVAFDGQQLTMTVLGLSELSATLQARAPDIFEAQGVAEMDGLLVEFKRDKDARISGLAVAPDALHELPFLKVGTKER